MKMPMIIIGVIMLVIGGLMAAGVFKYTDTDKMDLGPLELQSKETKTAPLNWGYLVLGGGAVLLVIGAVTGRAR